MGLFADGWGELKRKLERRKLRQRLAVHDRTLVDLFTRLGEQAIAGGVDLSGQAALRDEIGKLDSRAGELAAEQRKSEAERAAWEEKRAQESARFDQRRAEVEAKKQPVDKELAAARSKQAQQQSEVSAAESRVRALAGDVERARQQLAALAAGSAPDRQAQMAVLETKIKDLAGAQPAASEAVTKATSAVAPLTDEVNRWSAQSQQLADEIAAIEAERKKALDAIAGELRRVTKELEAIAANTRATGSQRSARAGDLGRALYAAKSDDARLVEPVGAVRAEEQARAATQSAIEASERTSRTLPPNTFLKFVAAGVAIVLLVVAVPVGGFAGWQWWRGRAQEQQLAEEREAERVNPYLDHALKGAPAYVIANQLADAKTPKDAERALLDAFRKVGLGVYTPAGQRVQGGGERSEKDFFLYDFQLRTLARGQLHPTFLSFTDFSRIVEMELVPGSERQGVLEAVLAAAMAQRYREAKADPNLPANFIVLLLDGLARRQPTPYSLDELSSGEQQVSPVQSLLIMMEFFMRPRTTARSWNLTLVPRAYAQEGGPCQFISGDAQDNFGKGSDVLVGLAGAIPSAIQHIAETIGKVTGVVGFVGDMLTLYGIDIHVQPEPYVIHLLHGENFVAGVTTTVTFDAEVVSDKVLECGWMAGKKMPVKGPLAGVRLYWDFRPALTPHLEMHHEMMSFLTGTAGALQTNTDKTGSSTFLIQPKDCPDREGKIRGQDYMAIVAARVVTAEMPTPAFSVGPDLILKFGPGTIEYFMEGRKGYARFRAEWHKKPPPRSQYGD